MVTTLSPGDKIYIEDSFTLILQTVEGNLVHFGIESSEVGSHCVSVHIEGRAESDLKWWELN
jgi:hypothetical protein